MPNVTLISCSSILSDEYNLHSQNFPHFIRYIRAFKYLNGCTMPIYVKYPLKLHSSAASSPKADSDRRT